MPYLIKCSKCNNDIIFDKLVVNNTVPCPKCFNSQFVSEYAEQISNSESKIRKHQNTSSKCPNCNNENKSNVNFCKDCGSKLNNEIQIEIIYCDKCGKEYEDDHTYCEDDGTELSKKNKTIRLNDISGGKIKCKFCAEEINVDAKICHHCGKKQKNIINKIDNTFEEDSKKGSFTPMFWLVIWIPTMILMILTFVTANFVPMIVGAVYWSFMYYKYPDYDS